MLLIIGLLYPISGIIAQQNGGREYTVKSGDTLYRIGVNHGVSVDELYSLNPNAKNGIQPGQVLKLPVKSSDTKESITPSDQPIYHKVNRGETLYSISRKYSVSIESILAINPTLKNASQLSEGLILIIPDKKQDTVVVREKGSTPPPQKPTSGITGLLTYEVPRGSTVYSLLKLTEWTEAQLYHYNPQIKDGLKAGITILIPDSSLPNNEAMGLNGLMPADRSSVVVLALPFGDDRGQRFNHYYKGFLMALLEAKEAGQNIHLYTIDTGQSLTTIANLPKIDLILGGVADKSIHQLARLAESKGATYVIPFTSKDYSSLAVGDADIYQVNTPHRTLYGEAVRKLVKAYKGSSVQVVDYGDTSANKSDFVSVLQEECIKHQVPFNVVSRAEFMAPEYLLQTSKQDKHTLVIPNSGSLSAAKEITETVALGMDSLGIRNIQPFGFPEWQTYAQTIGSELTRSGAVFYTTFYAESSQTAYLSFEEQFKGWYKHGLGSTYPKYSLLGYDTGRYFLGLIDQTKRSPSKEYQGIQSKFEFVESKYSPRLKSNLGVFFVEYRQGGATKRW